MQIKFWIEIRQFGSREARKIELVMSRTVNDQLRIILLGWNPDVSLEDMENGW
jgi:hypothetical protein